MNQTIEAIEERETIQPAEINQRIGYSVIIAERHSSNIHHIAEYIPGCAQYRLKTVCYQYFKTEDALNKYCAGLSAGMIQDPKTHTNCGRKRFTFRERSKKRAPEKPEPARVPEDLAKIAEEAKAAGLSERQLLFCKEYMHCRNATRSYMFAVPTVKNANAVAVGGSTILKAPEVKAYLESMGFQK